MVKWLVTIKFGINTGLTGTYEIEAPSMASDATLKNKAIEAAKETEDGMEMVKNNPYVALVSYKRL